MCVSIFSAWGLRPALWRVCFWLVRSVSWKSRRLFAVFLFRTEPRLRGTGRTDQSTSEYIFSIINDGLCITTYTVKDPKSSRSCCPLLTGVPGLLRHSPIPVIGQSVKPAGYCIWSVPSGQWNAARHPSAQHQRADRPALLEAPQSVWRKPGPIFQIDVLLLPLYLQPNLLTDSRCSPHCLNMWFGCLNPHLNIHRMI